MPFKFKIDDVAEIFKDPIGHYHHWTILIGSVVEGTIHRTDLMEIPAIDGTRLCTRVLDFELFHKSLGSEVSAGQYSNPIGIATWHPALRKADITLDIASDLSTEGFHEIVLLTLREKPSRYIHDRGPHGRGHSCGDCLRFLYKDGPVLYPDFASAIRNLEESSDPYIAKRAKEIISRSMIEEEYVQYKQRLAAEKAAKTSPRGCLFWKRR